MKSELQDQEGKFLQCIVIILSPLLIAICSQLLSNCEKKQQEIDELYVEMHSVNPQSQGEISDLKKIISGMLILKVNDMLYCIDLQSEVSTLKSEAASQGIEAIAFESGL